MEGGREREPRVVKTDRTLMALGQSHSSKTGLIVKQINAWIFLFWMTSESWHPQGFVPNHFLIFIYIHSLGDLIRFHGLWVRFMLTLSFSTLALISTLIPKLPVGCLIVLWIRHVQHTLPLLHPLPSIPHPVNGTTNYIFQLFGSENLASSLTPSYYVLLTSNPSPNPTDFISKINFPSVYFFLSPFPQSGLPQ